jgi:single-stranded-DNA-specific exonuclease
MNTELLEKNYKKDSTLSVMGKSWEENPVKMSAINQVRQLTNCSEIAARLIAERISDPFAIEHFITPKIKNLLPDPFHLKDMDKAVKRVIQAILENDKIIIFGDYDVDGATSSALLKQYFDYIKVKSEIYIPNRSKEGYGPSIPAFSKFKEENSNLVITLDCGTLAFDAVDHANTIGLDVIIIDHHKSDSTLPPATAVVNPNRFDEKSEYTNLAACGVGFLFLVALSTEIKKSLPNIELPNLIDFLDLVALGTVCDVMPLTGLNRAFVKQGLKIMKTGSNLGLKTLAEIAAPNSPISTYHLGFVLGPRINAGGRVGESELGAKLLSGKSQTQAIELANRLNQYNEERKQIELQVLNEAIEIASTIDEPVLVIPGVNWHQGVIGIIASRLKDKFNKPTVIISITGQTGKASSRSVNGFDIGRAVLNASSQGLIIEGGGHAMAAGFSINIDQIEAFKNYLCLLYNQNQSQIKKLSVAYYSGALLTSAVNEELLAELELLEPYGMGNDEPRFLLKNCFVSRISEFGSGNLSLGIDNSSGHFLRAKIFGAVGNNMGEAILNKPKSPFNFIGRIRKNDFYLTRKIEFLIDDILP